MIKDFFFVFWFFLPAGLANTAPVFAAKIPLLKSFDYPLDCGLHFRGKPVFGENKTFRGIISGVLVGVLTVFFEIYIYNHVVFIHEAIPLPYSSINPFILGGLLGFGSLTGDAIKSFFKRQIGIPSGKSWFFFDQLDYIFGGIIFTLPYIRLTFSQYVFLVIVWFLLHPVATFIGFLLKLKKSPI